MKLLRLHIQGFKSFKDKTTIHFDQGITGIVGPNGCGKSNIVDALFWVMGEQSAKHLRGKKMSDLIFSGSSKYSPGTFAEVTLVLENDGGKHIHIQNQVTKPTEIALTRKLYRNGETEYRINGHPARLKDIHEVFMDTGAGAKSYSIIAQGEINRLVQAKPEERRVMIEEVAGITKFKLRKRESLKKIEHTQNNLNRLEDLQNEIYKHLKSLERQAEKAERARSLKAKIQRHELIVNSHKEHDFLKDFKEGKTLLVEKQDQLEKDTLEKDAIELELEDERNKKAELMERVDDAQSDFNELSKKLAAAEERLNYLKKSREEKEKYIVEKQAENDEIKIDLEHRTARRDELEGQLKELEESNLDQMDFSDMEESVEIMKEQLQDKQDYLSNLTSELSELKEEFTSIDQEAFKNTSKLEEYAKSLQDINSEIESLEQHSSGFSDELNAQRDQMRVAEKAKDELAIEIEDLKGAHKEAEEEFRTLDAEIRDLSKEVITLESKRQSLIDINNQEDISEGADAFMETEGAASFNILGKLIESEQEFGRPVEVLFHEYFQSMISTDTSYEALLNWSGDYAELPWDLLSVDNTEDSYSETAERLGVRGCEDILAINDIIKVNDTSFNAAVRKFFNGFFIIGNLTTELAMKVAKDISFKGIISKDGSVFVKKSNGAFKISSRNPQEQGQGVVQRNNLINELTETLEVKEKELGEKEARFTEVSEDRDCLRVTLDEKTESFNKNNNEFISIKSSLESREESYKATFSRLEILNKRKQEISSSRLDLMESEETLLNKKTDFEDQIEEKSSLLEEAQVAYEDHKSSYEQKREELLTLQAKASSFQSQLTGLVSQIDDVNSQLERYEQKRDDNIAAQDKLSTEIEESEEAIKALEEANYNEVEELTEKEESLNLIKDQLSSLLVDMQERENKVKELTQRINKNEKSLVEIELKLEKIIEDEELLIKNTFEKYHVDLRAILSGYHEIGQGLLTQLNDVTPMYFMETEDGEKEIEKVEYIFEKRFPAQIRESREKYKRYRGDLNRLGEINWQAIEDYDRQKLRYDFLKEQEGELKKSLEDLQIAIDHIDEKSKARFKEAFEEVNSRFTRVFPIIFGGGEARLEVTGDLDSIECGIEIIAKPPGKKMQNINLMSGGEKAMTAVSLIFSIFLVKPSPFCLLDEVDAPLDDANVGRFNELLREMSAESQFILITHNKKTMELNDTLYGVTMQEPGVSKAVSVQLH